MTQVAAPAAVFIDRDGVLIRARPDYVRSWADVEILPGAFAALARLREHGHRVAVVSNQSAIGRGLVDRATVDEINARLAEHAAEQGGLIEAFEICPHTPWDGCDCRKPRPGLLLAAAARLSLDLDGAFMVGDQLADVAAARAAGCRPVLVLSGETPAPPAGGGSDLSVCADLAEATELILAAEETA